MTNETHEALLALRRRAEQRRHLVTRPSEGQSPDELQRLVQELQVHQIELEMQYEELLLAQAEVQQAQAQYVDLYDFAPVGYVTLSEGGLMEQLNLSAARLLGATRQQLQGRRFALFVDPADRPAFSDFLGQVFATDTTQRLEVRLCRDGQPLLYGQLEALRVEGSGGPQCRLVVMDISARRAAEAARAASETRFRAAFEQSHDGGLLLNGTYFADLNAAALRLLGLPHKSMVLGQSLLRYWPAQQPDGRLTLDKLTACLREATNHGWCRLELQRQLASGEAVWDELSFNPVLVQERPVMHVVWRDITRQRAAQELLRASEERLQMALTASETGTYVWDRTTGQVRWDSYSRAAFGQQHNPAYANSVPMDVLTAAFHPADADRLQALIADAIERQNALSAEFRVLWPDGSVHYISSAGRTVVGPEGQTAGFVGVLRDVTAQQIAEQELGYKNRLLTQIIEHLPVTLGQLTPDGRYVELLGRGLQRLGLTENELRGRSIFEAFPNLAEPTRRLLAGESVNFVGAAEVGGEPVYMQSYGFFDEQQQRAVVFALDVTDVVLAREEATALRLREQQQVLNAILATQESERQRLAESLHNGLGQLLYAAKLNLTSPPSPDAAARSLRLLDDAIRATRTISFELTPGVLNDFGLAAALRELAKRIPRQPLALRLLLPGLGSARFAPAVEIALYRITQELLNNVMKHSQATAATLHLMRVPGPPAQLRLVVEDNGQGFDPAAAATQKNAGIGLRSIRNRVELLGGDLTLDSRPGQGTTVTVELALDA